jgi:hypothetical protein
MSYKKHGQSTCKDGKNGSRFYNIWSGMRTRCNNPKSKDYKWYGAKGISVCPEWNDFSAFYKWAIENGYDDNKTIDRKQSNGNYSPENCKWSTTKEQLQNRSCTRYVTIYGVTKTLSEWSEDTGINYQTLITRLRKKWPLENILDTPDRKNRPKIKDDDIPVEWPD